MSYNLSLGMPVDAMLIGIEQHSMHAALLGSKPSKLEYTVNILVISALFLVQSQFRVGNR
jgi:hypothetical protein